MYKKLSLDLCSYFHWNPEAINAHLVIDVCVVFCPRFQLLHPLYLRLALAQVCLYPNVFLLGQFPQPSHQLSGAGRGESGREDGLHCGALHGLDARHEFPCPPQRIRCRFRVKVWRVPATEYLCTSSVSPEVLQSQYLLAEIIICSRRKFREP